MKNKDKLLTALLSLVIAFGLWVYVITVEKTEIEDTFYNVPVILDGESVLEERGLMITSDTDLTVTLKLSGNRSDLNKLKSSDITVMVDLTRIYEAGEKSLAYTVSFPGDIQNSAVEVVTRTPDSVDLTVVEWATKQIDVVLAYTGRVPDGYNVDKQSAITDVTAVTVTGPRDIINQIGMAKITVDLTDRSETIVESLRYSLCDEAGEPIEDVSSVTTNQGEIRVTVPIQKVKDILLTYTLVEGGGLAADDVTITMDYDTITVAGSTAKLNELGDEIDLGTIDLSTITESQKLTFPIELPEGVTNQSGITEVTVDVQLPAMETRTYTVTNFKAENVPAGMTVNFTTKVLQVSVRGRGPVLDKLTASNITVVVDFKNAAPGSSSYLAEIRIEGFDTVGAVEKYYVIATVAEA